MLLGPGGADAAGVAVSPEALSSHEVLILHPASRAGAAVGSFGRILLKEPHACLVIMVVFLDLILSEAQLQTAPTWGVLFQARAQDPWPQLCPSTVPSAGHGSIFPQPQDQ